MSKFIYKGTKFSEITYPPKGLAEYSAEYTFDLGSEDSDHIFEVAGTLIYNDFYEKNKRIVVFRAASYYRAKKSPAVTIDELYHLIVDAFRFMNAYQIPDTTVCIGDHFGIVPCPPLDLASDTIKEFLWRVYHSSQ